jgi:ATP-dependent DNA helicase HFM1/MER3
MKQIEQVGVVAVRKLAAAGITSIEGLECAEAYQIEMVLSKNPPFGAKMLSRLREFPKLRVAVKMLGKVCVLFPTGNSLLIVYRR